MQVTHAALEEAHAALDKQRVALHEANAAKLALQTELRAFKEEAHVVLARDAEKEGGEGRREDAGESLAQAHTVMLVSICLCRVCSLTLLFTHT